jgi:hypothetical protein
VPGRNASQRAEQRRLREQMRGLGMSRAEIAAEMARRYKLRPRAAWRTAWGWTLPEAADRYNALRGQGQAQPVTALTASRLSEWENWPFSTRKPAVIGVCLLAEMYQCGVLDLIDVSDREKFPAAELLALGKTSAPPQSQPGQYQHAGWGGPLPTRDASTALISSPGPGLHTLSSGVDQEDDQVRRRDFLGLTVDASDLAHMPESDRYEYLDISRIPVRSASGTGPARPNRAAPRGYRSREEIIAEVAAESQEFGEWVGMSEVADATIAQYRAQAQHLARVFEYEASFPLLMETRRLRDRVTSRLRGHQRLDQARELYLVAARVCGLLAWQTGDMGNYRAADTHAWTAWMCAEQAGHDGARAWVRATQAKLAYWDGRYGESALLAEDGLRYQSPDSARVFLALFRARALARIGQRDDARQALAQADTERTAVSAPDLLGGVWELTPGRYHGLAASTRLLLDEPERAVSEAAEALTLGATAPVGERHLYAELLVRTDQAAAYLRQPDLNGAAEALRPVLDLTADMRTEPLLQQLRRLRPTLALPPFADTPVARDLQEEIETYYRDALPGQITS